MNLDHPTNELIDKYISIFKQNERYSTADDAIIRLFKTFPKNDSIEDVLLKISVINDMYSTNILGTFKMAKHILKQGLDKGLVKGEPEIVHKIALGHDIRRKKNNTEMNFYSFATKYCNWHNQDQYAIYDSFVEKVLIAYQKKDRFSDFKNADLRDFRIFKRVISDFLNHYELTNYNLKEIDKFLWIYGKEKFPPKYSN